MFRPKRPAHSVRHEPEKSGLALAALSCFRTPTCCDSSVADLARAVRSVPRRCGVQAGEWGGFVRYEACEKVISRRPHDNHANREWIVWCWAPPDVGLLRLSTRREAPIAKAQTATMEQQLAPDFGLMPGLTASTMPWRVVPQPLEVQQHATRRSLPPR